MTKLLHLLILLMIVFAVPFALGEVQSGSNSNLPGLVVCLLGLLLAFYGVWGIVKKEIRVSGLVNMTYTGREAVGWGIMYLIIGALVALVNLKFLLS